MQYLFFKLSRKKRGQKGLECNFVCFLKLAGFDLTTHYVGHEKQSFPALMAAWSSGIILAFHREGREIESCLEW
jgi:hypothetical protein